MPIIDSTTNALIHPSIAPPRQIADPPPAQRPHDDDLIPPYMVAQAAHALQRQGAVLEILVLRGPADLITARHDQLLGSGIWILARFPDSGQPEDGALMAFGKR